MGGNRVQRLRSVPLRGLWLLCLTPAVLAAQADAERAAAAGELVSIRGQRVLRLYGADARERGFAHGYLLAQDFVVCAEDALKSLPLFTAEKYEQQLKPWATQRFVWDAEAAAEIEGLYAGLCARLGAEGLRSASLDRALRVEDLYALNAVADWFGPACSAFTAWGPLTEDGQVVHGRNLDFPLGPKALALQVVLAVSALPARGAHPARRAWAGVGWPGLVCVYSAMNAEGLVCCLHDANNVKRGGAREGFVARGLLLRRIVEALDPAAGDPADAAAKLAAERPTACGNLFHLSWPRAAAEQTKTTPAAVLEFDAQDRGTLDGRTADAVAVRRMDDSRFLVLTNHYCVRQPPLECKRFEALTGALRGLARDGKKLGLADARKLLICSELSLVAHTLVFLPDDRSLSVAISRGNMLSTRLPGTLLTWKELFTREEGGK
jgi:hypothetical protein